MLRLLPAVFLLLLPAMAARAQSSVDPQRGSVDLQLVLAVDISRSMDRDEQRLQRAGYVAALRDPEVIRAIESGPLGRIALTYVEWAGHGLQTVLVPWTLVDGAAAAAGIADRLAAAPLQRLRRTSISDALAFSAASFERSGFSSTRKVIDVSGDGPNNSGFLVTGARDAALDKGITINGLPIMLKTGSPSGFFDVRDLDIYYEDCVIGGFGAFIVTVQDISEFAGAIRRKLILEIAGRAPPARLIPAQWTDPQTGRVTGETDCQIGEKLWDAWMNGME